MEDSAPARSTCQVCDASCSNSCANCVKVQYCSKEHQRQDWKRHRLTCFPGMIVYDPVLGRHLVATRLISAGEVLIKETAIMSGPNGRTGRHPLCLGCYKQMPNGHGICSMCGWPMHPTCQKNSIHTDECEILCKNYMTPFTRKEVHMYEKLLVLRCLLLKRRDPGGGAWSNLRDLQSHTLARHQSRRGQLLSKSAIDFIYQVCQLQNEFSTAEIDHVVGVLSTNAFVTEDTVADPPGQYRSVTQIRQGDTISQLYGDATVGTLPRRQYLHDSKYFLCSCPRCVDPTELGSYFSGIKCLNCTDGYLLPVNPLESFSEWKCTVGVNCPMTSVQAVETLLAKIRTAIDAIGDENSLDNINQLEKLLMKYQLQLHSNHFLLHEIEQEILQRSSSLLATGTLVGHGGSQLDMASKMIHLSRKNLQLLEIICPGQTTHRGRQLYFLQQGLSIVIGDKVKTSSKIQSTELKAEMVEFLETKKLGAAILTAESELREEFLLGKNLQIETELDRKILYLLKIN